MFDGYRNVFNVRFGKMGISNPEIKAHILFAALDGLGLHLYMSSMAGEEIKLEPYIEEFMSLIQTWKHETGELS